MQAVKKFSAARRKVPIAYHQHALGKLAEPQQPKLACSMKEEILRGLPQLASAGAQLSQLSPSLKQEWHLSKCFSLAEF